MAKQGMKRPSQPHSKNDVPPVQELQGNAKHGRARPMIAGTRAPHQKVFHSVPHTQTTSAQEHPISSIYAVIDTDLARDNLENDIPAADLQDL